MVILKLILWVLIAYGITQTLVEGMIFKPVRDFFTALRSDGPGIWLRKPTFIGRLLRCFMCTGAWVGFLLGLLLWSPVSEVFYPQSDAMILVMPHWITTCLSVFFDGMLASCVVWFIHIFESKATK
jgi:hypothetical protein